MSDADIHYGWLVSPYSAKTRSYLLHTEQRFTDVKPTVLRLGGEIKRAVGRPIMPTVQLSDGRWLQDSSVIIDHYESQAEMSLMSVFGPTQRLASTLLEVFADEWLPMAALHYRWSIDENVQFALNEFAGAGLPWLPRFLGRPLVGGFARKMQGYLPLLGVDKRTQVGVEETVRLVLSALDSQLSQSRFLLGDRPCIGDFSLYGPLWAHLYRDPGSRYLFDESPHVVRWMEGLTKGVPQGQEVLPDDAVPHRLDPLFACILDDQWTWIRRLGEAIDEYLRSHPDARRVPRALGKADFSIRGQKGQRKLVTFVQWKAQRAMDAYHACNGAADRWLRRVLQLDPEVSTEWVMSGSKARMVLQNHKMVLDRRPSDGMSADLPISG